MAVQNEAADEIHDISNSSEISAKTLVELRKSNTADIEDDEAFSPNSLSIQEGHVIRPLIYHSLIVRSVLVKCQTSSFART